MPTFLHVLFLAFVGLVLACFVLLWIIDMLDKVSTLEEYAPWLVRFAHHKKWHGVVLLICCMFLVGDAAELYFKEVPEVPAPPTVYIEAPKPPSLSIVRINPPVKEQCWVKNYSSPAIPPWGLATIFCNTTIKPPYSIELLYDQNNLQVGPFAFPVGSEFAKSEMFNQSPKILAMFELHTIIPNEPFTIMAKGSPEKVPLVRKGTIRAKGLAIEFQP